MAMRLSVEQVWLLLAMLLFIAKPDVIGNIVAGVLLLAFNILYHGGALVCMAVIFFIVLPIYLPRIWRALQASLVSCEAICTAAFKAWRDRDLVSGRFSYLTSRPVDPVAAGTVASFVVHHRTGTGSNHRCSINPSEDGFSVTCQLVGSTTTPTGDALQPVIEVSGFTRKVSVSPRRAGRYSIKFYIREQPVYGCPIEMVVVPAAIAPAKCKIDQQMVQVDASAAGLEITCICKDAYDNPISVGHSAYVFTLTDAITGQPIATEMCAVVPQSKSGTFLVNAMEPGLISVSAAVKESPGSPSVPIKGPATLLFPPHSTAGVLSKSFNPSTRLTTECSSQKKSMSVCVSASQLSIKQSFLLIFSSSIFTMRVSLNSSLSLQPSEEDGKLNLCLDDGKQEARTVVVSRANGLLVAAHFHLHLLNKLGLGKVAAVSFASKRDRFLASMRNEYKTTPGKAILVTRSYGVDFVKSIFAQTSHYSKNDWTSNWKISFDNEQGIDAGGLRREFYTKLGQSLFSAETGLFVTFGDDNKGLVHPNKSLKAPLTIEYFAFAGKFLAKILVESALYANQTIPVHFTRSFLAQVLGLRIGFRYFESDDPEFYTRKVKFILENDVEEMDLVFAEEVPDGRGGLREVDLVPNGSRRPVTEGNKYQYLSELANFRLCSSVRPEIEAFRKGFDSLLPIDLVTIFDEQELELLVCGQTDYSAEDMKKNATIVGMSDNDYHTVLQYFWAIVASFTSEERARLLQFITGSSNLPSGGFPELKPRLQISSVNNSLPHSHTCFNMINLPTGQSYEELHRGLVIAINFASEGFGQS